MHPRTLPKLAALPLLLLPASLAAQRPASEFKNFTFVEKTFHSAAVGADMPYGVYLPKDYDAAGKKDVKWPLVIWLHGMFEDHLRFHGRGGAPVLDEAVTEGKLPPCVF